MPLRPPTGASRPTVRKFYGANQDVALAQFLATRNPTNNALQNTPPAGQCQPDTRRVRRRTQDVELDIEVSKLTIVSVFFNRNCVEP
jgi:hypothetical protein